MNMLEFRLLILSLLLVGVVACDSFGPPPCQNDQDCPTTLYCLGGICQQGCDFVLAHPQGTSAPELRLVFVGHTSAQILVGQPSSKPSAAFRLSLDGAPPVMLRGQLALLEGLAPDTNYQLAISPTQEGMPPVSLRFKTKKTPEPAALPVLPGPNAYGMNGPIARGKPIFRVSNLNESGPGSLDQAGRDAREAGGGTIVFEVSGVIGNGQKVIQVRGDNIVIAGQTAPSPGIVIKGGLRVSGKDVLIRHIGAFVPTSLKASRNAISVYGHNGGSVPGRLILDHVFAWGGTNANLSVNDYDGGRVLIQWSLFGPAMPRINGEGKTLSSRFNVTLESGKKGNGAFATLRWNLFTSATERQPRSFFEQLVLTNNLFEHRKTPETGQASRFVALSNEHEGKQFFSFNSIVGNLFVDTFSTPPPPIVCTQGGNRFAPQTELYVSQNQWGDTIPPQAQLLKDCPTSRVVQRCRAWHDGFVLWHPSLLPRALLPHVGSRPKERYAFFQKVIEQFGLPKTFSDDLASVGGEINLAQNKRPFSISDGDAPHRVEANGYTRLENELHRLARELH